VAVFWSYQTGDVCRDSVVGIAVGYGLDGPGSNPRGGRDFPHQPWEPLTSYKMGTLSFLGVKRLVCGVATHPCLAPGLEKE